LSLQTTVNAFAQSISVGHGNYCLCHGAGGNADLLISAADVLARPEIRQAAEAVGRNGIVQFHATDMPWPCGVNGGGETPNLMLGLAGIGYFYLRLYDSTTVPSVLLVRPVPISNEAKVDAGSIEQAA
jgi:lantibiotic modifying enzyme